jgi:hypothetical protein
MKFLRRPSAGGGIGRRTKSVGFWGEGLEEGASVAMVARRHGFNANLLFTWRRQLGAAEFPWPKVPARIVPVTIATEALPSVPPATSGLTSSIQSRLNLLDCFASLAMTAVAVRGRLLIAVGIICIARDNTGLSH